MKIFHIALAFDDGTIERVNIECSDSQIAQTITKGWFDYMKRAIWVTLKDGSDKFIIAYFNR